MSPPMFGLPASMKILLGAEGTLHTHLRKGENLGMRTASVVPVAPLQKIGFNDNDLRELG